MLKYYTDFMMKNIFCKFFLISTFFLCLTPLFAQEYSMGAILDPVRYEQTDAKPVLHSRNYTTIPNNVSLKQYSPIPESQGQYGTCVGWSTAFAARTISESIALNRTNARLNSSNAFSPIYVYKSITNDPSGKNGACISDALDLMKNNGIVKRLPEEKNMDFSKIILSQFSSFQKYQISNYVRLFSNPNGVPGTVSERVLPVKKSIAEGKPVIIGMNCPNSFFTAKDQWQPNENPNANYGGHAMCVVGYDDDKYGGAFEIQNSWGTNWGNDGYIWINYRNFAAYVYHAYEIIENLAVYKNAAYFAASIKIEVYNDEKGMPVRLDKQGFYKTEFSYLSGTEFRFLMTNHYPAYVYAFSADSFSKDTVRIFPLYGVSPVLDYSNCTIIWPGEYKWIKMDDIVGIDYLVVLYAKEALDIDAIQNRFANAKGNFQERVSLSDFLCKWNFIIRAEPALFQTQRRTG